MGSLNCGCTPLIEDPLADSTNKKPQTPAESTINSSASNSTHLSLLIKAEHLTPLVFSKWSSLDCYHYPDLDTDFVNNWSHLILADGFYTGEHTQNTPNGRGYIIYNDGTLLEGIWKEGKVFGKARVIFPNADYFEGNFINSVRSGFGKLIKADGQKSEGDWKDLVQEGEGRQEFTDGSIYIGGFIEGKKHGIGRFNWSNGSYYYGEFKEDLISGKGIYEWENKKKYEGEWVEGKIQGKGTFCWPDGRRYVGEFFNDYMHGVGKYYWPNGNVLFGVWEKGKKHGEGFLYVRSRNQKFKGLWVNGVRQMWIVN